MIAGVEVVGVSIWLRHRRKSRRLPDTFGPTESPITPDLRRKIRPAPYPHQPYHLSSGLMLVG